MLNGLSIDVEDWFHPELVRERAGDAAVSRVETATGAILDLLARYQVKATFFIVGEVARDHPELVRRIVAGGHEVACHGFSHRPLWELTPESLAGELAAWAEVVTPITGRPALGFRAPTFSLEQKTAWAIPVLRRAGYRYDSSIFPVRNYLYGVKGAPAAPYHLSESDITRPADDGLWEFPMTVWSVGPVRLPVAGGFYLRLLPLPFLVVALRQVSRHRPFALYIHPWETDAGTPRLPLPALDRWVTYYRLGEPTRRKLEALLQRFPFAPLTQVLL